MSTKNFNPKLTSYLLPLAICIQLAEPSNDHAAWANPKEVEKIRSFYRTNNMDFFGDLVADSTNLLEDEKKRAKIELLADDARIKALTQLDKLLSSAKGPMEAEFLLRKATLLSDRARTAIYFQNNPFKSKLKTPKFYLDESIENFLKIEKKFPEHPKMDVVIFSIAYNYGELKRVDDSLKYYLKVVQKFPESNLVGDSRLAIAEIYFDKRKFSDALSQLKEIVQAEQKSPYFARLKNFALYKMAWTYYNMSDLDSAILALERVIEGVNASSAQTNGVQRAKLELRKEALHDLVGFYAESRPAENATTYFEKIAKTPEFFLKDLEAQRSKKIKTYIEKNEPIPNEDNPAYFVSEPQEQLLRLVSVYRDQGKHEASMSVALQLIDSLKKHPKTPALYRLRAESAEKLRKRDLMIQELNRLSEVVIHDLKTEDEPMRSIMKTYNNGLPENTIEDMNKYFAEVAWKKNAEPTIFQISTVLNKKEKKDEKQTTKQTITDREKVYLNELKKISFETFKDFATFLHGEWLKTQQSSTASDTATKALRVYDLAIQSHLNPWRGADLEALFELRSQRAKLHFALQHWDQAAQDFHWLTMQMKNVTKETLKDEIAALEAHIKNNPIQIKKDSLHPFHERLIKAYDAYIAFALSKSNDETSSLFIATSSRLYKEYGKTKEALDRMLYYTMRMPKSKDAVELTRDVLSILEKNSRWEDLRNFSAQLLEKNNYEHTAAEKELKHSNEYATLRLLESLEENKDWKKASTEFAEFAKKNPNSNFASQALMKAAHAALEIKDLELSIERLEQATHAQDQTIRLNAFLALEPLYRKSLQWNKLLNTYSGILNINSTVLTEKIKTEAIKNKTALKAIENFTIQEIDLTTVNDNSKELKKVQEELQTFDRKIEEFKKLRFLKSNNNPASNFKKKTDAQTKIVQELDKYLDQAPKALKGGILLEILLRKTECFFELAETLKTAALPSALLTASDIDRKSYIDTIDSQVQEIRKQALGFLEETIKNAPKVDSPFEFVNRFNKLSAQDQNMKSTEASRQEIQNIWKDFPRFKAPKKTSVEKTEPKLLALGLELLKILEKDPGKNNDEKRALQLQIAQKYLESEQYGFARETALQLIAENNQDELAAQAEKIIFTIETLKLPETFNVKDKNALEILRWNIATYLVQTQLKLKDFAKIDELLNKEQLSWFSEAAKSILKIHFQSSNKM